MTSTPSTINASVFVPKHFANIKTGQNYCLVRADSIPATETNLQTISTSCNQREIYEFIFRSLFQGQPYTKDKAKEFFEWAKRGWAEEKYFVFLITDSQGKIAGALDIKSSCASGAEIGYWASSENSGIMTPAVQNLCEMAAKSGFNKLFAFVKTTNQRSSAVLERSGFKKAAAEDLTNGYPRFLFEREL